MVSFIFFPVFYERCALGWLKLPPRNGIISKPSLIIVKGKSIFTQQRCALWGLRRVSAGIWKVWAERFRPDVFGEFGWFWGSKSKFWRGARSRFYWVLECRYLESSGAEVPMRCYFVVGDSTWAYSLKTPRKTMDDEWLWWLASWLLAFAVFFSRVFNSGWLANVGSY